jgi:predicted amidohydrolase
MRAAAIQLEPVVADVAANLEACERLADQAAAAGADWIALPEFFTTGVAFHEELAGAAVAPDGAATELLRDLARRHGATVGGSFLCRDPDGDVRNAYFLAGPDGAIQGRHDKDLPTMWENAFYIGGAAGDDGVLTATDGVTTGIAVCWELMRSQTATRMKAGGVELVIGGSCWWSVPPWPPRAATTRLEAANARTAARAPELFARVVGAPVIHAAHAGPFTSPLPWLPFSYKGYYEGGAVIADARGQVLARRDRREGPGLVIADVTPGRHEPLDEVPDRFWLHKRGPMAAAMWHLQRAHGRRWYPRHVQGRPPFELDRSAGGQEREHTAA